MTLMGEGAGDAGITEGTRITEGTGITGSTDNTDITNAKPEITGPDVSDLDSAGLDSSGLDNADPVVTDADLEWARDLFEAAAARPSRGTTPTSRPSPGPATGGGTAGWRVPAAGCSGWSP
ncbi:hypothetical protein ACFQ9X_52935 [Catenulispora yoronensis]